MGLVQWILRKIVVLTFCLSQRCMWLMVCLILLMGFVRSTLDNPLFRRSIISPQAWDCMICISFSGSNWYPQYCCFLMFVSYFDKLYFFISCLSLWCIGSSDFWVIEKEPWFWSSNCGLDGVKLSNSEPWALKTIVWLCLLIGLANHGRDESFCIFSLFILFPDIGLYYHTPLPLGRVWIYDPKINT